MLTLQEQIGHTSIQIIFQTFLRFVVFLLISVCGTFLSKLASTQVFQINILFLSNYYRQVINYYDKVNLLCFNPVLFFFQLLQSGSSEYHVILGAKCLQITSEEFISPREDVSFARKTELKNFLTSRVLPDIFTLLLRKLLLQLVLCLSYHKKILLYIYKKKTC